MAEIKTPDLRATPYTGSYAEFESSEVPGAFWISAIELGAAEPWQHLHYLCPCGCNLEGRIRIGNRFKPGQAPSWAWNGDFAKPVLTPSINHVGHWHGYLGGSAGTKPGIWESC